MTVRPRGRIQHLQEYLNIHDWASAFEALDDELQRQPESVILLLQKADVYALADERDTAIKLYRKVARYYADQKLHARAIAVINKILRLDPNRQDITHELAGLIAAKQQSEQAALRQIQAPRPPGGTVRMELPATPELKPVPPPQPASATPAAVKTPDRDMQASQKERDASNFFAGFPAPALEELLTSTCVRSFSPGDTIVREGEPGTSLFLIEQGDVEVHTTDPTKRPVVLAQMGPGEFFGEVSVLTGKPRTATIVAKSAVTAIEISRDELQRISARYPEVQGTLRTFYEQRAHATVEVMLSRLREKPNA